MRAKFKRLFRLVAALATVTTFAACVSSTTIASNPQGARLFLNGAPVGVTPYTMSDTKITGSATTVHLELPGYAPVDAMIVRSEELDAGALIAGIFLLVPLLWVLGYQPVHVFELRPAGGGNPWAPPPGQYAPPPGQYAPPPAGYPGGYPPPPPQS